MMGALNSIQRTLGDCGKSTFYYERTKGRRLTNSSTRNSSFQHLLRLSNEKCRLRCQGLEMITRCVSLHQELDEINKRLTGEEKKCKLLTRERDAAKRKADRKATNYENERKKQKASSESSKYWKTQVKHKYILY